MRLIEICSVKSGKKKNGFYWHEVIKKAAYIGKESKTQNVVCFSIAYDSYSNALRSAVKHNSRLAVKYPIYFRGVLKKAVKKS
jgi:hypothetical protein